MNKITVTLKFLFATATFAQINISGIVTDTASIPIPGATEILEKYLIKQSMTLITVRYTQIAF